MKDIPVFTTENGVASLVLKEIPIRGIAYIKLLSSQEPRALLAECVDFCRACGAEAVHAAGDACLADYPLVCTLVEMSRSREGMEQTDAAVFPVTEQTAARWREVCNERMAGVPNAAYMTAAEERKLPAEGDSYFVHREGTLLGIGRASGGTVDLIAAVQSGAGRDVVLAMAGLLTGERVKLTVALENERAVRLYERLGFLITKEVSRWYKIL